MQDRTSKQTAKAEDRAVRLRRSHRLVFEASARSVGTVQADARKSELVAVQNISCCLGRNLIRLHVLVQNICSRSRWRRDSHET